MFYINQFERIYIKGCTNGGHLNVLESIQQNIHIIDSSQIIFKLSRHELEYPISIIMMCVTGRLLIKIMKCLNMEVFIYTNFQISNTKYIAMLGKIAESGDIDKLAFLYNNYDCPFLFERMLHDYLYISAVSWEPTTM